MIRSGTGLSPGDLLPKIARLFALSEAKIRSIEDTWQPADGAPVFTVQGRYQARGWTEWTQGFQFGSALLQFDAEGDTVLAMKSAGSPPASGWQILASSR